MSLAACSRRMGLIGRMRTQSVAGFALRAALMLMAAVALSGCLSRGGSIPYDPADFGKPDQAQPNQIAYDLPLGPLDLLKVNVFRVPELSGDYQVDAKGMLDLPLLGPLNVRGYSPQQFADLLETKYGERYIRDPEISVRVMSSILNSVTVEGGVNIPGMPIPAELPFSARSMARRQPPHLTLWPSGAEK
jgi:polysaccharide biosynthesis/export protein